WHSKPYRTTGGKRRSAIEGIGKSSAAIYRAETVSDGRRFPLSIIREARDADKLHPTQKPVALFRYLIRTYTQPGELVSDPTCGSGTTGVAARQEARHFIIGDSSAEYVAVARRRLAEPYTIDMFAGIASSTTPG